MGLKSGYRQTDIGVIPEEWTPRHIEDFADISTGGRNTQDRVEDGEYPFFVRSQVVERINTYSFEGEAVLTAGDGVGTGKVFHYIVGRFEAHQRVYRISGFRNGVDGYFFYLYFSNNFYNRIAQMTAKSSVDSVRREMIARMQIPVPPTEQEQQAIGNAVRDIDVLISKLEQLIIKKRDLKQAAMQKLLTGQTRLPGFSGNWKTQTLGEIATIKDGTHQTPNYVPNGIPFYSVEHVTSGDFANTKFISEDEHQFLTKSYKIEKGDVLMTRIGSIGDCKLIDWDVNASFYVSLALLKIHPGNSAAYVVHYSRSVNFQHEIEIHSLPSAIPRKINLGPISKIKIALPELNEQNAIASVLTNMDAELAILEQRLAKTRDLKQAMMQELLTGKTRLVTSEAIHA